MGASINNGGVAILHAPVGGVLDHTLPHAWMCHMKLREAGGAGAVLFSLRGGGFSSYEIPNVSTDGATFELGSSFGTDIDGAIPIDTIFHFSVVRELENGPVKIYVDAEVVAELSSDASGYTATDTMEVGGLFSIGQLTAIDVHYMKAFQASRTQAEIQDEMASAAVVHSGNIWGYWEFPNDGNFLNDTSGNGHHWTTWAVDPPFVADPAFVTVVESGTLSISATPTVEIASSVKEIPSGILSIEASPTIEISSSVKEIPSGVLLISATPTIEISGSVKEVESGALEIEANPTITIADSEVIPPGVTIVDSGPLNLSAHPTITVTDSYKVVESGALSIIAYPTIDIREEQVNTVAVVLLSIQAATDVISSYKESASSISSIGLASVVTLPELEPV